MLQFTVLYGFLLRFVGRRCLLVVAVETTVGKVAGIVAVAEVVD